VTKQRYKEFKPTLRVATDYQSVEKSRYCLCFVFLFSFA